MGIDQPKPEEVKEDDLVLRQDTKDSPELVALLEKSLFTKEITPDPEITSAETAITKLEAEGFKISNEAKYMLTQVNWEEKLDSSYEIVSFKVIDLFNDTDSHTFSDIKIKAQELRLDLIPQALSPSIRLNYPKDGDWTIMALKESIQHRDGRVLLLFCGNDIDESPLNFCEGGSDGRKWSDDTRLFFVRK